MLLPTGYRVVIEVEMGRVRRSRILGHDDATDLLNKTKEVLQAFNVEKRVWLEGVYTSAEAQCFG